MKQYNTPQLSLSTFVFSGTVRAGQPFLCTINKELTFKLTPDEDGWELAVFQAGRDENLAVIRRKTGSSRNHIDAAAVKDRDAKNLSREWGLAFPMSSGETIGDGQQNRAGQAPRDPIEGRGRLRISDLKFKKQAKKLFVSEMSFDVILQLISLPLIDGQYPLFITRDMTPPKGIFTPDPVCSEEARQAKYQGTVVLWIVIGKDGRVQRLSSRADLVRAWMKLQSRP